MKKPVQALLAALTLTGTLFAAACNSDDELTARLVLPPYPYWENDAIRIDTDQLQSLATAYCRTSVDSPSSADFFLEDLPLISFNDIFEDPFDRNTNAVLSGNIYLSGYFGGLWLRNILHHPEASSVAADESFDSLKEVFDVLVWAADHQMNLVETGSDWKVVRKAKNQIGLHLLIYAYNRGYLEQIIEHPPAGVVPPEGKLVCSDDLVLDCQAPELNLPFTDLYDQALEDLRNPPSLKWKSLRRQDNQAWSSVEHGRSVWNKIDISNLNEEQYLLLVDLSLNFLLVSQGAVLGNMTAWADGIPDDARHGLLAGSGMVTWGGSYAMGLMLSPASDDTFPLLECVSQ